MLTEVTLSTLLICPLRNRYKREVYAEHCHRRESGRQPASNEKSAKARWNVPHFQGNGIGERKYGKIHENEDFLGNGR
jgi:hypothetical protein